MQQCRVTTAVTQPKEEVVVGCFFFEKKKKEKKSVASSWTTRNDFFNGKLVLLFLQEKMIKYIAYRLNQYLQKITQYSTSHDFSSISKRGCYLLKADTWFSFGHKRKQMDCLLIKPHLQLKRWKNMSNTKLKSFLSLSHLKGSLTSLLT